MEAGALVKLVGLAQRPSSSAWEPKSRSAFEDIFKDVSWSVVCI